MNSKKTCIVEMSSVTHAMKVTRLLQSKGYYCSIQRNPGTQSRGCSYYIYVNESVKIVKEILYNYNITANCREG